MGKFAKKGEVVASASGLIVGTGAHTKRPGRLAAMVLGGVLLAGLAGGGARWFQSWLAHRPLTPSEHSVHAQSYLVDANYTAAQKELDATLADANLSVDDKYTLTSQKATVYENQKDYKNALMYYQKAQAIKPTQDVAESIGRVAEATGDKQQAISEYKVAVSRIPKSKPTGDADRQRYQAMIANLGGTL